MNKPLISVTKVTSAIVAAAILLLVLVIAGLFGFFSSNQAKKDFRPIAKNLNAISAKLVCDNGDGGHGPDNTTPWYDAFYYVKNSGNLPAELSSVVSQAGFSLKSPVASSRNQYSLTGSGSKAKLDISVANSPDSLTKTCADVGSYGLPIAAPSGQSVVEFNLTKTN